MKGGFLRRWVGEIEEAVAKTLMLTVRANQCIATEGGENNVPVTPIAQHHQDA